MAKKKKNSRRKPASSSWFKNLLNKYFIVFLLVLGFCGGVYCLNSIKNTHVLGLSTTGETTYEKCTQQKPTFSVSPKSDNVNAGETVKYSITVNNKNCKTTEYLIYGKAPAGWEGTFDRNSESNIVKTSVKIGAYSPKTVYFYVKSPQNKSASSYQIDFSVVKTSAYLGDAYFNLKDSAKYVIKKADSSNKDSEKSKASAQKDSKNNSSCKPSLNYIKYVGHPSSVDYYFTVKNNCDSTKDIDLKAENFSKYNNAWVWNFAHGDEKSTHTKKDVKKHDSVPAVLTVGRAYTIIGSQVPKGTYSFVVKASLKSDPKAYDTVKLQYKVE